MISYLRAPRTLLQNGVMEKRYQTLIDSDIGDWFLITSQILWRYSLETSNTFFFYKEVYRFIGYPKGF